MREISERIKYVRNQKGFSTQEETASYLGVKRATYANYESGRTIPNSDFLNLLCTKFNINGNWLLTGEGDMMGQAAAPQPEPMAAVEAVDYLDPGDVTKDRINTLLLESAIQHTEEMYSHEPPPKKATRIMNSYKRLLKAQWDPGPDDPPLNDAARQHLRGEKRKCRTENSGD